MMLTVKRDDSIASVAAVFAFGGVIVVNSVALLLGLVAVNDGKDRCWFRWDMG